MRALNVPQTILCPVRRSANQDLPTAPAALQHAWCDRCRRAAPPVAGGNAGQWVARRRVCTGGAQATPWFAWRILPPGLPGMVIA